MHKLTSFILVLFLCLAVMPLPAHAQKRIKAAKPVKERLVLMPLRVSDEDVSLLGSMEIALVQGMQQKYEVFSGEQVATKAKAIFLKESRNLAKKECDETRCMQDIAMAFQAELIATANVTKRPDGYFLALSIQNIFDNKVVYSNSIPCQNCNAYQVVEKLKELSGTSVQAAAPVTAAPEAPATITGNPNNPGNSLWAEVQKGNSSDDYNAYLAQYPKGKYVALAKTRLKKLQEQEAAEARKQKAEAAAEAAQQEAVRSTTPASDVSQLNAISTAIRDNSVRLPTNVINPEAEAANANAAKVAAESAATLKLILGGIESNNVRRENSFNAVADAAGKIAAAKGEVAEGQQFTAGRNEDIYTSKALDVADIVASTALDMTRLLKKSNAILDEQRVLAEAPGIMGFLERLWLGNDLAEKYNKNSEEYYLREAIGKSAADNAVQIAAFEISRLPTKTAGTQGAWEGANSTASVDSYAEYLSNYPQGQYAPLATARIAKLKKEAALLATVAPKAGKSFKDCPDCPEMVVIPAGSFEMGLNGQDADEKPQHRVSLKAFAMGKTEVTQGQWRAIMGSNPSKFTSCGDNCPVEQVSWNDAKEYIQKLNAKTGKQYRLPSEAEWEYACRAGQQTEYCGGNDINSVAWYGASETPVGNSAKTTNPVATKQANAFGLYDMSGNVWEWVEDSYHDTYNGAPADGTAWQGDGAKRVLRGGSWNLNPLSSRAAFRFRFEPATRILNLGFRLARMLP